MESVLSKKRSRKRHVLTEELDDIGTQLEESLSSVGWQYVMSVQSCESYSLTKLQPYTAFCLQIEKQEFDIVGDFRNRYLLDCLARNIRMLHSVEVWFTLSC